MQILQLLAYRAIYLQILLKTIQHVFRNPTNLDTPRKMNFRMGKGFTVAYTACVHTIQRRRIMLHAIISESIFTVVDIRSVHFQLRMRMITSSFYGRIIHHMLPQRQLILKHVPNTLSTAALSLFPNCIES